MREVSQSEHEEVSTRIVANYNHMHALTVQYYEVVQIYRVSTEIHTAVRCLFIPMEPIDFNDDQVIDRFRGVLTRSALNARVVSLLNDEATAVAVKGTLVSESARVPISVQLYSALRPTLSAAVVRAQKLEPAAIKPVIAAKKDG